MEIRNFVAPQSLVELLVLIGIVALAITLQPDDTAGVWITILRPYNDPSNRGNSLDTTLRR